MRISPYALLSAGLLGRHEPAVSLATLSLNKVLQDASPVFGSYIKKTGARAEWMKRYPDHTKLVHMNIPGVHDSATWNYTQATQDKLLGVTNLGQAVVYDPRYFRCQDVSIVDALNSGIRAFDLRYALDVTNSSLVFFHAQALQSETATVEDVLFGFYQWLTDHPSETVMLSFQYEGSTMPTAQNNAAVQLALYNLLTSPAARQFFVQTRGRLGTLGDARGKITLLRRFDLDQLPSSYEDALPGLHFSPNRWTDNGADIALQYNSANNLTAYVEDYYNPTTDIGSSAEENIRWKYNATTAHISKAIEPQYRNDLFWTWASSENVGNLPPDFPEIQALGNGTAYTPSGGVNLQLVPFLKDLKGKRVGILMLDFFEQPSELLDTFLGL
ncbi:plc-like phosphodiesterase [Ophiostoma piceae UAMH 11346]|uniref:Plc-like phosphodiesterase n=1 Tax=Ophiostoma piceae (strain UAMH 11346) TaxID=1262450 RepID=S3BX59_OPHP1|nr:plc-like phosphodiesterase [Ophiostoma piceae UAMH 11346]